jgi:hypothetical protein
MAMTQHTRILTAGVPERIMIKGNTYFLYSALYPVKISSNGPGGGAGAREIVQGFGETIGDYSEITLLSDTTQTIVIFIGDAGVNQAEMFGAVAEYIRTAARGATDSGYPTSRVSDADHRSLDVHINNITVTVAGTVLAVPSGQWQETGLIRLTANGSVIRDMSASIRYLYSNYAWIATMHGAVTNYDLLLEISFDGIHFFDPTTIYPNYFRDELTDDTIIYCDSILAAGQHPFRPWAPYIRLTLTNLTGAADPLLDYVDVNIAGAN